MASATSPSSCAHAPRSASACRLPQHRVRSRGRLVPARPSCATQGQPPAPPAAPPPPATQLQCLKEWAPTCAALGTGEQMVVLRKGGIREPAFRPAAADFLLFPTSFHTEAQLLKPEAQQRYAAEVAFDPKALPSIHLGLFASVTGAWTTRDPRVLELLSPLHVWAPEFLEARLRWRERQPITVLELRTWRLHTPLTMPSREGLWGCFSWVGLEGTPPFSTADMEAAGTPALDDAAFAAKQRLCRQRLAQIQVLELEV